MGQAVMVDTQTLYMILLRWVHFVAGITWIGLLYWFNLINVPWQKTLEASMKPKITTTLLPKALWWFRHSATITVLVGVLLLDRLASLAGGWAAFAGTDQGRTIIVGGLLGVIMWFNVWFIIWPNQRKNFAAAQNTVDSGAPMPKEAAVWMRHTFLASRTNFVLSLPMLVMMGSSSHLGSYRDALILGVLATLGGLIWVWYLGQPKPTPAAAPTPPATAPPQSPPSN